MAKKTESKVNESSNFSERYKDSKTDINETIKSTAPSIMSNNSIMKRLSIGLIRRGQLLMKQVSKEQPKTQPIEVIDDRSPE
jgi:hypothetical protein